MTFKFNFGITNDLTGTEEIYQGEFTYKEHELILDFLDYVKDLFETSLIEKGDFGRFEIQQKGEDFKVSVDLPNWNDAMLFIYKLRPLILKNERTYFHNVSKLLGKKFDIPFVRGFLKLQKDFFTGKHYQSRVQYRSNQALLNSEEVLFDYLNGFEYHREKDKQKFIESLHVMLPLNLTKVIFLGLLKDKAIAIANLADFLEVLLGRQQEIEVKSKMKS